MIIKYNMNCSTQALQSNLKRIINQIYKLLPLRQEGQDWQKPLQTIIQELAGLQRLLFDQQQESFLILLCKLEGMNILVQPEQFSLYRRTIFECLSLLSEIRNYYGRKQNI